MGIIHLVDGEKGGVGKSTFCRPFIEYLQDVLGLGDRLVIIDADQEQPFIGRTYAPDYYPRQKTNKGLDQERPKELNEIVQQIGEVYFSENEEVLEKTDTIFNLATQDKVVVVNLPAAVFPLVNRWITKGELLTLAEPFGVQIWKWFVTDGGAESIDTLKKSFELYHETIHHVIVKNKGLTSLDSNWWSFDSDEDLKLFREASDKTYCIELPRLLLSHRRWEAVKREYLTLRQASDRYRPGMTITQKHKVHIWRKQVFLALSKIPLGDVKPNQIERLIETTFIPSQPQKESTPVVQGNGNNGSKMNEVKESLVKTVTETKPTSEQQDFIGGASDLNTSELSSAK